MTTWQEFTAAAPRVSAIFAQRHHQADRLCLLGSLRADGYPRISPVEPCIFEGHLVISGMPRTTKFRDLARDPRFTLHTTVTDDHADDGGEAKLWGVAEQVDDRRLHRRFKQWVYDELGHDIRGLRIDGSFFLADIEGGSTVEADDHGLKITVWKAGETERSAEPGKA
jgi:hypothetical protein